MSTTRKPKINAAVYNVPEIAALLNINLVRAYEIARRKDFPSIRIGNRIVVPKEAFHRWLNEQAIGGAEDVS